MKTGFRKSISVLAAFALLAVGMPEHIAAAENGVTVSTPDEFMAALQAQKSPIKVSGLITIGDEAEASGRMIPVKIPANTEIHGISGGRLISRSPVQLEGDVLFQDIGLTFPSSDALGSVPHREIFLAGHHLTLDNVSTWLQGGGGSLGELGGTEEELLPTVYAGGFTGTNVGGNASLTVRNSNAQTIFQEIHMGHTVGNDNKVPYQGTAVLNLDANATVRGRVDVSLNSSADIAIAGSEGDVAKTTRFYGNDNTTLTVNKISLSNAIVENIGNIILTDKACLTSKTSLLGNVTLRRGGCLNLNEVSDVRISGKFMGETDSSASRGILVVNQHGSLVIGGTVTGTTQFQTYDRLFPGSFIPGHPYISVNGEMAMEDNFVLSEKSLENGYQLKYNAGEWSVDWANLPGLPTIGSIEITSAPSQVVLDRIKKNPDGTIPDENIYFGILWRDENGTAYSAEEAEEGRFYDIDYIFKVKTSYWNSDDPEILERTDWGNAISLMTSEKYPGRYFLQADEDAVTGDYTFLFCSDYYIDDLDTVGDLKDLKGLVLAEKRVVFLDKEPETTPMPAGTASPTPAGTATPAPGATASPITSTSAPPASPATASPTLAGTAAPTPGATASPAPGLIIAPPKQVTLSTDTLVYTGKAQKPKVTITDASGNMIDSSEYRLAYKNNSKVGQASVTVYFSGKYGGTLTKYFQIIPKGTKISSLSVRPKGLLAKWKKQRTQTSGYEIQYSTSRKFAKGAAKKIRMNGNKKTSKMIPTRKSGKKYYARIRTYKTVWVQGRKRYFYSRWSKVKSRS